MKHKQPLVILIFFLILLVSTMIVFAGCGEDESLKPLIKSLNDSDKTVKREAVKQLGESGDARAIKLLINLIRDELAILDAVEIDNIESTPDDVKKEDDVDLETIESASSALITLGLIDRKPYKIALRQDNVNFRMIIVGILGNMTEPETVDLLVIALKDKHPAVKVEAIEALRRRKDPRSIVPLFALLADDNENIRREVKIAIEVFTSNEAIEPLIQVLKNDQEALLLPAINLLGKIQDKRATKSLSKLLDHENSSVREVASQALLQMEDPRTVDVFIDALKDNNRSVRRNAIMALGRLGDPRAVAPLVKTLSEGNDEMMLIAHTLAKFGEHAVEPLIALLENPEMVDFVSISLQEIGDSRAKDPLFKILEDQDIPPLKKRFVLLALAELNDKRLIDYAITYLGDETAPSNIRQHSAQALGKFQSPEVLKILLAALKDKDVSVRKSAALSLGNFNEKQVIQALINVLDFRDSDFSIVVLKTLAKLKDPSAITPIVEYFDEVNRNPGRNINGSRKEALIALREIGRPAVKHLIPYLQHKDMEVREGVAYTLGHIGDPSAIKPLASAMDNSDNLIIIDQLIHALGKIKDPKAVKVLVEFLRICNAQQRQYVINSLSNIGTYSVEPMIELLGDENYELRRSAIVVLKGVKDPASVPSLIEAVKHERYNNNILAMQALGEIKDERATETLLSILNKEDEIYHNKVAAMKALGEIKDKRAIETLLSILDCENGRSSEILRNMHGGIQCRAALTLAYIGDRRAIEPLRKCLQSGLLIDEKEKAEKALDDLLDSTGGVR